MSDSKTFPTHLKLVTENNSVQSTDIKVLAKGTQSEMFPLSKPHLLIFSDVTNISSENFLSLISEAKPRFILDLRPTPRFDFGRLNRRATFEVFKANGVIYVDVTGLIGVTSKMDANLNPSLMARSLNEIMKAKGLPILGPLLFLFDDSTLLSSSIPVFADSLVHSERKKWEVCLFS